LALSKTHDVLTRENWGGAELQEVAEEVVRPYRQTGDERFEIGGPVLRLTPGMALSLSMALHELCTNAVKYGALSNTRGRVSITWTLASSTADAVLRLLWQESGGPPVVEPRDKGFGTRLLERGIARELGGTVEIRYAPAGLVCIIEAPMPILATESDQPLEAA
jgi:two-component sensor histidine kinase